MQNAFMTVLVPRLLKLPKNKSFFLFGARGVGKSTWLKESCRFDLMINLLRTKDYLELSRDPGLLEAKVSHLAPGSWVCIDEIQRVPALLTEVHRLIEDRKLLFALTESSARKLKKGDADLLAGRAIRKFMEPLSFSELGKDFDLKRVLEWGCLPMPYFDSENTIDILDAYVHTYLREEIKEEGLVRKLDPFLRFIEVAGLLNGQIVNAQSVATDAKIPRSSVDSYFSILEDTLVGFRLSAYQPNLKVREVAHPKFYWFDSGVARACSGRLSSHVDGYWLGCSLETYLFHELRVYNQTFQKYKKISYYRTAAGSEIDFVIELEPGKVVLIEVKLAQEWDRSYNRSLIEFKSNGKVQVEHMIGVYCGRDRLTFGDLTVWPVELFLENLYSGAFF